jgi:hypothetical protein
MQEKNQLNGRLKNKKKLLATMFKQKVERERGSNAHKTNKTLFFFFFFPLSEILNTFGKYEIFKD